MNDENYLIRPLYKTLGLLDLDIKHIENFELTIDSADQYSELCSYRDFIESKIQQLNSGQTAPSSSPVNEEDI